MALKMPAALSYIFLCLMITTQISQTLAKEPTEQDLEQARKECDAKNKLFCPKYGKCCEKTDFCHEGTCETCFPKNMTEDSRLGFCQQLFNNSSPLSMRSNSCDHLLVCRSLFSFKELLNIDEQDFQINWLKQNMSATQNEIQQLKEEYARNMNTLNESSHNAHVSTKKLEEELKLMKQSLNSTFMEKAKFEQEVKEIRDELAHQKDLHNKNQILEQKATKELEEELKLMKQSLNSTFLEKAKFEKEVKEIRDELAHQKDLHNKNQILEQKATKKFEEELKLMKQSLNSTSLEYAKLEKEVKEIRDVALGLGVFAALASIGAILTIVAIVVARFVKTDWCTYLFPAQSRDALKSKNYQLIACKTNEDASNHCDELVNVTDSEIQEKYVTKTFFDEFVNSNLNQYVKMNTLHKYVLKTTLNKHYLDKKDIEKSYLDKKDIEERYLDKKDIEERYLDKKDIEERYLDKKDIEERYLDKNVIEERYLDKKVIEERYLDKEELEDKFEKKDNPKIEKPVMCCTNAPEEAADDVHVHMVEDCSKTLSDLKIRFEDFERDTKHQVKAINAKLKVDDGNHMVVGPIQQPILNPPQSPMNVKNNEIESYNKDGTDQETDCLITEAVSPRAVTLRTS